MAQTYSSIVSAVAELMIVPTTDPNYQAIIPQMMDDAELRMQRDLDLVDNTVVDTSGTLTTGSRSFTLPTSNGTFIVIDSMNVISPVGTSTPDSGTRNPMTKCSIEMLNALFPTASYSGVPQYYTMLDQDRALIGPFPNAAYNVEVTGSQRFTPLYLSQTTSPLSVFFPDLYVAACMVFASGYQRQFGAGADDPKQAQSWEGHYQALLASAQTEEARKKFLLGEAVPQPATPKG